MRTFPCARLALLGFALPASAVATPVVTSSFIFDSATSDYTYRFDLSFPDNALNTFAVAVQIGNPSIGPFPVSFPVFAHTEPAMWEFHSLCSTAVTDPATGTLRSATCWLWTFTFNSADTSGSATFTVTTTLPPSLRPWNAFDPTTVEFFSGEVIGPGAPDIPPPPPPVIPEPAPAWSVCAGAAVILIRRRRALFAQLSQ